MGWAILANAPARSTVLQDGFSQDHSGLPHDNPTHHNPAIARGRVSPRCTCRASSGTIRIPAQGSVGLGVRKTRGGTRFLRLATGYLERFHVSAWGMDSPTTGPNKPVRPWMVRAGCFVSPNTSVNSAHTSVVNLHKLELSDQHSFDSRTYRSLHGIRLPSPVSRFGS